ncbi:MAG: hypothetical protein H6868_07370 [Rhodospirillales bacterium]|nr:hypothetical protein [Rhodospirillales bacterium]
MSRTKKRESGKTAAQNLVASHFSQNDAGLLGEGLRAIFEHHSARAIEDIAQKANLDGERLQQLMNDTDNAEPLTNQEFSNLAKAVTKFLHK